MATIRLHERDYFDEELGKDVHEVQVLERSAAELARVAAIGGRVFDLEGCLTRQEAELLLESSRQLQPAPETDPKEWGRVEELKRRVTEVALPEVSP